MRLTCFFLALALVAGTHCFFGVFRGRSERRTQVSEMVPPQLNLKQLQLLRLIQEQDVYSKIQNEKDDDQIYTYGLTSLEHPERMRTKKLTARHFPKIVSFLSRLNFNYNLEAQLLAFGHPLTAEETRREGLAVFEQTKTMLFDVLYDFQSLTKEVDKLYARSDQLGVTGEELVEIYGFKPLFDRLKTNEGGIVSDTLAKINLKAYEWNEKAKTILEMIGILRRINVPFYQYLGEIADRIEQGFTQNDPDTKVKDAADIMKLLLVLKSKTEFSVESMQHAIMYMMDFRLVLLDLISRLQPGWYLQSEEDGVHAEDPEMSLDDALLDNGGATDDDQGGNKKTDRKARQVEPEHKEQL